MGWMKAMARPLLVSDCDEVLLYMLLPFTEWLDEAHQVHFDIDNLFHIPSGDYRNAMRCKEHGEPIEATRIHPLLKGFFATEMHRQKPIPGAVASINALADHADIVILTNLTDDAREARAAQLRAVGIDAPVYTNQGGKGATLKGIIDRYQPSQTVFVDDLPPQHLSVAEAVPGIHQLHFVGEPRVARQLPKAEAAHARIDDWQSAQGWIMDRFEGVPL
jgi:FMN phosphatase YigB (HAD superfamily)